MTERRSLAPNEPSSTQGSDTITGTLTVDRNRHGITERRHTSINIKLKQCLLKIFSVQNFPKCNKRILDSIYEDCNRKQDSSNLMTCAPARNLDLLVCKRTWVANISRKEICKLKDSQAKKLRYIPIIGYPVQKVHKINWWQSTEASSVGEKIMKSVDAENIHLEQHRSQTGLARGGKSTCMDVVEPQLLLQGAVRCMVD